MSQGRIVYQLESAQAGGPRMMVWHEVMNESQEVDVGLDGGQSPGVFEYPWIVFRQVGGSNPDLRGFWAFNLESERLVQLYQEPPDGRARPDGSKEFFGGAGLLEDRAYHAYHTATGQEDETSWHGFVVETDLGSGAQRVIHEDPGARLGSLVAGHEWVVWSTDDGEVGSDDLGLMYAWSPANETTWLLNPHRAGGNKIVTTGWVVYTAANRIQAINRSTHHVHELFTGDSDFKVDWNVGIGADGDRVVFVGLRMTQNFFTSIGYDLYWLELP